MSSSLAETTQDRTQTMDHNTRSTQGLISLNVWSAECQVHFQRQHRTEHRLWTTTLDKGWFPWMCGQQNVKSTSRDNTDGDTPILQPFRHFTYVTTHFPTFRHLTYVTARSPTLPILHLRHSSLSDPSFASPTSQALHLIHLVSRPCQESNPGLRIGKQELYRAHHSDGQHCNWSIHSKVFLVQEVKLLVKRHIRFMTLYKGHLERKFKCSYQGFWCCNRNKRCGKNYIHKISG